MTTRGDSIVSNSKISVICLTYNHERYLEKCLKGFVRQKTNFAYEVFVHDDASTDNTVKIIERYAGKYPEIIRPLYEQENQYSKGKNIVSNIVLTLVKSEYIAICEGDDFWIDPNKLQNQVDALDRYPECHMCVCRARVVNEGGKETEEVLPKKMIPSGLIDSKKFLEYCIDETFQTSGFVMRAKYMREYYENNRYFAQTCPVGDIPYRLYFASVGPIFYFSNIMTCYRSGSLSSIQKITSSTLTKKIEMHKKMIETYRKYDEFTKHKYSHFCREKILRNEFGILYCEGNYKSLLDSKYRSIFKSMNKKRKIDILISAVFPFLTKIIKKIVLGTSNLGL